MVSAVVTHDFEVSHCNFVDNYKPCFDYDNNLDYHNTLVGIALDFAEAAYH